MPAASGISRPGVIVCHPIGVPGAIPTATSPRSGDVFKVHWLPNGFGDLTPVTLSHPRILSLAPEDQSE
jgi:hypothetical protein